jgi:hypothetical protein
MSKRKNDISEVGQNELSGHIIPLDTNIEEFFGGEISEFEQDRRKMLKDIQQLVSAFKGKWGIKELQVYCVNMAGIDVWVTNPLTPPRKRIRKSIPQDKKTAPDY